jgi:tRNA 2-thiouridine synthesizing protein A
MNEKIAVTLDCKGLSCPMPIMKLAKAMKALNSGEILEMLGTDPGTKTDLPKWCEKMGNSVLEATEQSDGVFRYLVKKK